MCVRLILFYSAPPFWLPFADWFGGQCSVVDEINQGMDSVNERKIFNMISQATEERADAPQYFLVTPKLLPNLELRPSMTVLVVANGYVPPPPSASLRFPTLTSLILCWCPL